ncbi:hypothetical protein EV715DRAFT_294022 [Schizophyllum commune]
MLIPDRIKVEPSEDQMVSAPTVADADSESDYDDDPGFLAAALSFDEALATGFCTLPFIPSGVAFAHVREDPRFTDYYMVLADKGRGGGAYTDFAHMWQTISAYNPVPKWQKRTSWSACVDTWNVGCRSGTHYHPPPRASSTLPSLSPRTPIEMGRLSTPSPSRTSGAIARVMGTPTPASPVRPLSKTAPPPTPISAEKVAHHQVPASTVREKLAALTSTSRVASPSPSKPVFYAADKASRRMRLTTSIDHAVHMLEEGDWVYVSAPETALSEAARFALE